MRIGTGGGLWGQFHALFVPKAMATVALPTSLVEAVLSRLPGSGHKWYAAEDTPRGVFTAVDYEAEGQSPGRFLDLALWDQDEDGSYLRLAGIAVRVRFDEPFSYTAASRIGEPAPAGGSISAVGGWAWDHRIKKVIGITADGHKDEFRPINGCWLLLPADVASGWQQFLGVDNRGTKMYGRNSAGLDY